MGESNLFGAKAPRLPHLVRGSGGLAGEINDLRGDIDEAFVALEDGGGYLKTEEFTNPAAADVNALKLSIASAVASQLYSVGDLDGVIGAGEMSPPRNVTVTTSAHADIDAVPVLLTGTVADKDGNQIAQTDTITLTNGGGVTDGGTKAFSFMTSILVSGQSGAGGLLEFGFGSIIGLARAIKTRAGLTAPIREVEAGAVVTTGTFTTAAAQAPHGTYLPGTVPDAANDYAVTYEVDPAV